MNTIANIKLSIIFKVYLQFILNSKFYFFTFITSVLWCLIGTEKIPFYFLNKMKIRVVVYFAMLTPAANPNTVGATLYPM